MRAFIAARHVSFDSHFISASAAKHRRLRPFRMRPDFDRVAGQSLVTFLAREIYAAALHLDSDDVESGSIVSTANLRIQIDAANLRPRGLHK